MRCPWFCFSEVAQVVQPEKKPIQPEKKPIPRYIFTSVLPAREMQFIFDMMSWIAFIRFDCRKRNWYFDENLRILLLPNMLIKSKVCIQPFPLHDIIPWNKEIFFETHHRLMSIAIKFAEKVIPSKDYNWYEKQKKLIALCIVVAEVVEEFSFWFNFKNPNSLEISKMAFAIAFLDDERCLFNLVKSSYTV